MIVKAVYLLATLLLVLIWLAFIIAGFVESFGVGPAVVILGAIAFVVYLALVRITLEFYLTVVRMSEDIHQRLPGS